LAVHATTSTPEKKKDVDGDTELGFSEFVMFTVAVKQV
jgi:hypothetical protein